MKLKINNKLNSCSMAFLVNHNKSLTDPNISNASLIKSLVEGGYTLNSARTMVNQGKSIIDNHLNIDALNIIDKSKATSKDTRHKARVLLAEYDQ
jgi:hypothetical protein